MPREKVTMAVVAFFPFKRRFNFKAHISPQEGRWYLWRLCVDYADDGPVGATRYLHGGLSSSDENQFSIRYSFEFRLPSYGHSVKKLTYIAKNRNRRIK